MNFIYLINRYKKIIIGIFFSIGKIYGLLKYPFINNYISYSLNALRSGMWSIKLAKVGKFVQIDKGVIIRGNPKVVSIDDYSYLDVNVQIEAYKPIKIGKYVHIASNVHIQSGAEITIGDYAAIASGSRIFASSNTYKSPDGREKKELLSMSASAPKDMQYVDRKPIIIDEFAFIGINAIVLPGVKIGKGAIIGAGSIVTRDIPAYSIAVGSPAVPIKKRPGPISDLINE